ncbi:ammonium transporter AmtB-like domain-containing protein [Tuber brumale]|nr:ammonium transporter AmtB-like domain-containing protein [Tuber brumale]
MDYGIACTVVVWPMIPGIGFLYGGLAGKHASLGLLWQSFLVSVVISFQWLVVLPGGFSEAATDKSGGGLGIRSPTPEPRRNSLGTLRILVFFCVVTVQIMIGGTFECGKLLPSLLFGFVWATVVYHYAGSGPVHVASGFSALAYALVLGKRQGYRRKEHRQTLHKVTMVFLGTCFIWFGWLSFNGGSALNATIRAICGIIGWVTADYFRKGKFSVVDACEGAIAGISTILVNGPVGITPAAGYVAVWFAALIGFVTAVFCSLREDGFSRANHTILRPPLLTSGDVWLIYLRGGMTSAPGAIDGNGIQVAKQLVDIPAIASYSFAVSAILLLVMNHFPGLRLRPPGEADLRGLDQHEFCGDETGGY